MPHQTFYAYTPGTGLHNVQWIFPLEGEGEGEEGAPLGMLYQTVEMPWIGFLQVSEADEVFIYSNLCIASMTFKQL